MSKINVKYQDAYSYNLDNTYMKKWEPAKYDSKVSEAENEELTSSISGNKTEEAEDKKDDKKVAKRKFTDLAVLSTVLKISSKVWFAMKMVNFQSVKH